MRAPEVILLPSDESPCAESAREIAESLAARFDAQLHDLFVATLGDGASEYEWPPDFGAPAPADPNTRRPVVTMRSVRISDSPGPGILQYAREIDADLIVIGSHARDGVERLVRGSTAEYVLRRAQCPVLLVPPHAGDGGTVSGRVLVAHDFSYAAARALDAGHEMAAALGLPLDVLHVVEVAYAVSPFGPVTAPIDYEAMRDRSELLLREVAAAKGPRPVEAHLIARVGGAVDEIVRFAEDAGTGLIVVGTHGRRGVRRFLLGSVAEGVARRAHCPVLVVPDAWNPALAEGAEGAVTAGANTDDQIAA